MVIVWPDEKVSQLKDLHSKGFTASHIAKELGKGTTRNAVIGKINRLRLISSRPARNRNITINYPKSRKVARRAEIIEAAVVERRLHKQRQAAEAKAREHALRAAKLTGPDLPLPESRCIKLKHLTAKTCRWPLGDPQSPTFAFCGAEIDLKHVYCTGHRLLAYTPRTEARGGA